MIFLEIYDIMRFMTEPDKVIIDPAVRLRSWGVHEWRVDFLTKILPAISHPDEVGEKLREVGATIDSAQLLMPAFRAIYQNDSEVRRKVQEKLIKIGVSTYVIDEYFIYSSDQPYVYFHLAHEPNIPLLTREVFIIAADQVILKTLQTYFGFIPPKEEIRRD